MLECLTNNIQDDFDINKPSEIGLLKASHYLI